jgi:hypothetical protein
MAMIMEAVVGAVVELLQAMAESILTPLPEP